MTERRRRRSRDVALVVLPALALAFSACGGDDEETAYCVDENDQVVENQYCDEETSNGGVYPGAFFWYYGGRAASGSIAKGAKLKGGDKVVSTNVAENVRRGGFGSSGKSGASGVGRASSASSGGG